MGRFRSPSKTGAPFSWRIAGDGASVVAEEIAWVDPFVEPVSPENREFVDRSGKWEIFDVSADREFSSFLGKLLTVAEVAHDEHGILSRVTLGGEGASVTFFVEDDRGYVDVRPA
jgi:hypothetical protein